MQQKAIYFDTILSSFLLFLIYNIIHIISRGGVSSKKLLLKLFKILDLDMAAVWLFNENDDDNSNNNNNDNISVRNYM